MARMHSRARGKSGSKKPIKKTPPSWLSYKGKETELLIVKFAKEGKSPSQIGIYLRDVYGIPQSKNVTGKRIAAVLKEKKLLPEIPEDLNSLIRKSIKIQKHLEENKKDETAKRGFKLTDSKIKRLIKYYKNSGRLPKDWSYDVSQMRLIVE